MLRTYPIEAFESLAKAIRNDDESEQKLLVLHGFPELSHFWDALEGVEPSFRWLLENDFRHLAAIVDGLTGKDTAKVWLLKSGYPVLAAFIDAAQGNASAVKMLLKGNHKGWIVVARAIHDKQKKKDKNMFWGLLNFGNPFR
jgi:hypothetical protein